MPGRGRGGGEGGGVDYRPGPGTENVEKFLSNALVCFFFFWRRGGGGGVGGWVWALPELTDGDAWDHSSMDINSPLQKLRGEWYE